MKKIGTLAVLVVVGAASIPVAADKIPALGGAVEHVPERRATAEPIPLPMKLPIAREPSPEVDPASVLTVRRFKDGREEVRPSSELPKHVNDLLRTLQSTPELADAVFETLTGQPSHGWEPGGTGGAAGEGSSGFDLRNFSSLGRVTPGNSWPWSYRVRVTATPRAGFESYGSGVLIDSRWVLTVGHNVHGGSGRGWYSNFRVFPAFDGSENSLFRSSDWESVVAWTPWMNSSNFQYDLALIELERPVGGLTGWAGYGYHTGCSFFEDRSFRIAGYPAESPYDDRGRFLYQRSGDFDSCSGNVRYFNAYSYGGESGSGATTNDLAYGVLSHGTSTRTGIVAIWPAAFSSIRDIYVVGQTPSSPDLVPLSTHLGATSVRAGASLPFVRFYVHNYSRSTFSGAPRVSVYLSTDRSISRSDRLLGTWTWSSMTIGSKATRYLGVNNVAIPASAPRGSVFIGVLIENADAATSNNDGAPEDAAAVSIN